MRIILAFVLIAATSAASWGADDSYDIEKVHAAERRMAERQRAAATRPATTRPAAGRASSPPSGKVIGGVRLKMDTPQAIVDFFQQCADLKVEERKTLPKRIAAVEAQIRTVKDRDRLRGQLRELHQRLARIQSQDILVLPRAERGKEYRVGYIGCLGVVKVRQVIDAESAIVGMCPGTIDGGYLEVEETSAYLQHIDTAGWTDSKVYEPSVVFEVVGTKQYTTVLGGSRTILLAQPVDYQKWIDN